MLRLRDTTSTIKVIEFVDKTLDDIHIRWPTQQKIFDQMDREPPRLITP